MILDARSSPILTNRELEIEAAAFARTVAETRAARRATRIAAKAAHRANLEASRPVTNMPVPLR